MNDDDELTRRFQTAQTHALAAHPHDTGDVSAGSSNEPTDPAAVRPYCSSLQDWVAQVFAPTYPRRPTPTFRWCAQWWRHPEAISRLEALWRSWETLRLDPLLGMATWYRDYLDTQLPILTAAAGPFADCDPTRHFAPETDQLAHTPTPEHWWPTQN